MAGRAVGTDMGLRSDHRAPTPASRVAVAVAGLAALVIASGCGEPPATGTPEVAGSRPGISIDGTWGSLDGEWTFTGQVDPKGDPTDVILEVGPGPVTLRRFDTSIPVADGVLDPGPLEIVTREIPDVDEICVRFTARNSVGSSSSSPLCVPHDPPTFLPPGAPTVTIDPDWTVIDGDWAFTAHVDPERSPTTVVMEVGPGPATDWRPVVELSAAEDLVESASLTVITTEVAATGETCVRFTATNGLGTTSSELLCVTPGG